MNQHKGDELGESCQCGQNLFMVPSKSSREVIRERSAGAWTVMRANRSNREEANDSSARLILIHGPTGVLLKAADHCVN